MWRMWKWSWLNLRNWGKLWKPLRISSLRSEIWSKMRLSTTQQCYTLHYNIRLLSYTNECSRFMTAVRPRFGHIRVRGLKAPLMASLSSEHYSSWVIDWNAEDVYFWEDNKELAANVTQTASFHVAFISTWSFFLKMFKMQQHYTTPTLYNLIMQCYFYPVYFSSMTHYNRLLFSKHVHDEVKLHLKVASSAPPCKCQDNTSIRPLRILPNNFQFIIVLSPYHPTLWRMFRKECSKLKGKCYNQKIWVYINMGP